MIREQRLLDCFLDLVRIDSLTFEERGLADYIGSVLSSLEIPFTEDAAGVELGGSAGNLIARVPGASPGPTILLAAHMDTVAPGMGVAARVKKGVVAGGGDTVLGADDKAGCAVILEVLRSLKEAGSGHPPLEAVFTVAEEKGLLGAGKLDLKGLHASAGFVLDGDGPVGNVVIKAPYQDYFKAVFHGKAAHAGVEPEKGVSAIKAAAEAVARMKLGRLDDETTANIGVIEGGRAINIVADTTVIEGEARSHSLAKLKVQIEEMRECALDGASMAGARVEVTVNRLYDGFAFKEDDYVVREAVAALERTGVKAKLHASGGGSDTNVFNKAGIAAVNLSVGAQRVHTTDERIEIGDMVRAARAVHTLVTDREAAR